MNIYLFQILHSVKVSVFIKIYAMVYYIQIWFKCETPLWISLIKIMVYIKNSLKKQIVFLDHATITELRVVHTWRHMQSEYMK